MIYISNRKNLFLIFLTVFYLDYFYILFEDRKSGNKVYKNIIKKDIISLYCENIAFTCLSMVLIVYRHVLKDEEFEYTVFLTFLSSIISATSVNKFLIFLLGIFKFI